jgi:biopolymer transport protein ExbD
MKHDDFIQYRQLLGLRRAFVARSRRFPPVMDPVALADVVLLVLLFFITQSPFVARPGVLIELPRSDAAQGMPLQVVVVTLAQGGMVYYDDERTTLEALPAAFARMAKDKPDHTLVLEADELVSHKDIVRIYEEARKAGIGEVALATRFGTPGESR